MTSLAFSLFTFKMSWPLVVLKFYNFLNSLPVISSLFIFMYWTSSKLILTFTLWLYFFPTCNSPSCLTTNHKPFPSLKSKRFPGVFVNHFNTYDLFLSWISIVLVICIIQSSIRLYAVSSSSYLKSVLLGKSYLMVQKQWAL